MKLLENQFEFLIIPARLEHALTSKRFVHWQKSLSSGSSTCSVYCLTVMAQHSPQGWDASLSQVYLLPAPQLFVMLV